MTRVLTLGLLLAAQIVQAQTQAPTPVLTTPTTTSSLAWNYTPGPTETPLSALHHFDVQWTPTGLWASANTLLTVPLPTLTPGAYVARVRACALVTTTTGCTMSAPLAFTVVRPRKAR